MRAKGDEDVLKIYFENARASKNVYRFNTEKLLMPFPAKRGRVRVGVCGAAPMLTATEKGLASFNSHIPVPRL